MAGLPRFESRWCPHHRGPRWSGAPRCVPAQERKVKQEWLWETFLVVSMNAVLIRCAVARTHPAGNLKRGFHRLRVSHRFACNIVRSAVRRRRIWIASATFSGERWLLTSRKGMCDGTREVQIFSSTLSSPRLLSCLGSSANPRISPAWCMLPKRSASLLNKAKQSASAQASRM